ncbi:MULTISPECIES: hypothetical protein [Psychrobacter]|jgi:hypothetical protein|uniref:hypothetical protein n=1 Tax=Psychrobacter TaxID=497 RepID=UPI000471AE7D|nr:MULTISPECIES: hypothetical protein [Psychrobacter]
MKFINIDNQIINLTNVVSLVLIKDNEEEEVRYIEINFLGDISPQRFSFGKEALVSVWETLQKELNIISIR